MLGAKRPLCWLWPAKILICCRHIVSSDQIADEIFGFHAQQAVEKSLKAWICVAGGTVDRIHDLRRLLIVLQDLGLDIERYRELIPLNSYAVQFRYEAI